MRPLGDEEVAGLMWVRSNLVRLYVVKKAPAGVRSGLGRIYE